MDEKYPVEEEDLFADGPIVERRDVAEDAGAHHEGAEEAVEDAEDPVVLKGREVAAAMRPYHNALIVPVYTDPPLAPFDTDSLCARALALVNRHAIPTDPVLAQWSRFAIPAGTRTWGDITDPAFRRALASLTLICKVAPGTLEKLEYNAKLPLEPFLRHRPWVLRSPDGHNCPELGLKDWGGDPTPFGRTGGWECHWSALGTHGAYVRFAEGVRTVRDDLDASIRAAVRRVAMRTMAASALDRIRPALGIPTGPMNVVPTCLLPPKVQEAVSALALQERSAVPVRADTEDFIHDLYDAQLEVAIGLARTGHWKTLMRAEAVLGALVAHWMPVDPNDTLGSEAHALLRNLAAIVPPPRVIDRSSLAYRALELAATQSTLTDPDNAKRLADAVKVADGITIATAFVRPVTAWCQRAQSLADRACAALQGAVRAEAPATESALVTSCAERACRGE